MKVLTEEAIADFKAYLEEEEKSCATVEKYIRDVYAFYHFLDEEKQISKEVVILYKKNLLDTYTVTSANSMLAALNGFLTFMELQHLKVKRYQTQRRLFCAEETELSKEEYMRLLQACQKKNNKRLQLILLTICGTGIRISELEYFTVEAVKKGIIQVYCKSKVRIVFIPELLRTKLLDYIEENKLTSGYVFVTRYGNPVNRSNIWTQMKRLCREAEIPPSKVFPHNLRHLFARTYYASEHDITRLADLLGHSSIETTRVYTISSGREHERQVSGLGLVI